MPTIAQLVRKGRVTNLKKKQVCCSRILPSKKEAYVLEFTLLLLKSLIPQ